MFTLSLCKSISLYELFIYHEITFSVSFKAVCLFVRCHKQMDTLHTKPRAAFITPYSLLSERNETWAKFSEVIINRSQFTNPQSRMNADCVAMWRLINHLILPGASLWEINLSLKPIIERCVLQFSSGLVER